MSVSIDGALDSVLSTLRRTTVQFGGRHPADCTIDGRYPVRGPGEGQPAGTNWGWTTGFWPGMRWLAWEVSGDEFFSSAATGDVEDFDDRVRRGIDLTTHDLGFLYTLSCVSAWRLTGNETAGGAALRAADALMVRFLEPAGVVQAWGDLADVTQRGRIIIDSLMNMPLLVWAFEQTGDPRFIDAVRRHTSNLREHIVRADDTTFHTYFFDPVTGDALHGATAQGASDDSCWARGQAWGIYGFALNYRALGDEELLETARRCADYFLAHLPADGVAYWDLIFADGDGAPRDSSAAAIAACGLLELAALETDPHRAARYRGQADRIVSSLIRFYTPETPEAADGVLLHGVYNLPVGAGIDEANLWGDYFYLEALVRIARPDWQPYWWPDAQVNLDPLAR